MNTSEKRPKTAGKDTKKKDTIRETYKITSAIGK
jgi:hypothetical protein